MIVNEKKQKNNIYGTVFVFFAYSKVIPEMNLILMTSYQTGIC